MFTRRLYTLIRYPTPPLVSKIQSLVLLPGPNSFCDPNRPDIPYIFLGHKVQPSFIRKFKFEPESHTGGFNPALLESLILNPNHTLGLLVFTESIEPTAGHSAWIQTPQTSTKPRTKEAKQPPKHRKFKAETTRHTAVLHHYSLNSIPMWLWSNCRVVFQFASGHRNCHIGSYSTKLKLTCPIQPRRLTLGDIFLSSCLTQLSVTQASKGR